MSEEYEFDAKIEDLCDKAAAALRAARGRPNALQDAILAYLREGYHLGLGPSELTDYFCVSTPSIVEAAEYLDDESEAVMAVFDQLHNQFRRVNR